MPDQYIFWESEITKASVGTDRLSIGIFAVVWNNDAQVYIAICGSGLSGGLGTEKVNRVRVEFLPNSLNDFFSIGFL